MSYEQKDGDIIIFKNEEATGNQPPYTGKGLFNGEVIKIALWVKEGKKGKFFAGRIQSEQEKPAEQPTEMGDDLPF